MSKSSKAIKRQKQAEEAEERSVGIHHWIFFALAFLYAFSPIDIIPDIPVFGWFDDITLLATTGLNLLQQYFGQTNETLNKIVGGLKWITIILGSIAVLIILLLGALIIKLFS